MDDDITIKLAESDEEIGSIVPEKLALEFMMYGNVQSSLDDVNERLKSYRDEGKFLWIIKQGNKTIGYAVDYAENCLYKCLELSLGSSIGPGEACFELAKRFSQARTSFAESRGLRFMCQGYKETE